MHETEKMKERYAKRKEKGFSEDFYYSHYGLCERELNYFKILKQHFGKFENLKIIEIGAGSGDNLIAFKRKGFKWENIYANELLEDRVEVLKQTLPISSVHTGDASQLEFDAYFDVTFHSLVFTSILDDTFKKKLAQKMFDMTKKDGLVLWYDFKYNNPNNPDVKGVGKEEIKKLFPDAKEIVFHSVTLAPPIGRRVGKFYNFFNIFPFLRTHIIAEIYK